jgi:hypothetical protein
MVKKFDPDCPLCRAVRADGSPEVGLSVVTLKRSTLFLTDAGELMLTAQAHMASPDEMYPKERELFAADISQVTEALAAVSAAKAAAQPDEDGGHLHVRFAPALPGTPETIRGDVRQALGYMREPVSDPHLKDWLTPDGRVTDWPSTRHPDSQSAVRAYLASKFEPGRAYTEPEVNAILNNWTAFRDWELLRRELFNHGFLNRYKDGSKYWQGDTEPA